MLNIRKKLLSNTITIIVSLTVKSKMVRATFFSSTQSSQPTSLADSRIRASAAGVRGLMIHLKGVGCLFSYSDVKLVCSQYVWISLRQESTGELGFELDGVALVIDTWCNVINCENTGYNELSLRCFPGHILGFYQHVWWKICWSTDRRPKPNVTESGSSRRDWVLHLSDTVRDGTPWGYQIL